MAMDVDRSHCVDPPDPRREPSPHTRSGLPGPAQNAANTREAADERSFGISGIPETRAAAMSPSSKALVDRCSVALFAVAWLAAAAHLAPGLLAASADVSLFLTAPSAILAGYLVADFLAGTAHWIADRHFDPDTPLLGPMLIAPFRAHHDDAESISRHDFFEVSGNNALATVPVVLLLLALPAPSSAGSVFLAIFGLSLTVALVATNQFHGWAHARRPPPLVRRLHRMGLILTPKRHARHHHGAHDRAYCVTSGWLNPLLDGLRFYARIDARIDERIARATAKSLVTVSNGESSETSNAVTELPRR